MNYANRVMWRVPRKWEARSALRWGSRHEGYFETEAAARQFAEDDIRTAGGVGKIEAVTNNVVYYTIYENEQ